MDAATLETAVIGRLGNNFQFSDQRERSENTKISIKTWSIAEKTSVSVAMTMMMLPAQQGVRRLGIPPPSISEGDGGDDFGGDIKEKLNTSGTSEQCPTITIYHQIPLRCYALFHAASYYTY